MKTTIFYFIAAFSATLSLRVQLKISAITLAILFAFSAGLTAQKNKVSRYETFVYTTNKIDLLIQNEHKKQGENSRGFLGDLGGAFLNAGKGVAGGYIT